MYCAVLQACRATAILKEMQQGSEPTRIHPNDHVNMGQSSNDTIPTVSAGSAQ